MDTASSGALTPPPASPPVATAAASPAPRKKRRKLPPVPELDPQTLAERTAEALVHGNGMGLQRHYRLGPVTEEDRNRLQRITGETVEQFNVRISDRLRTIADLTAQRIIQKLDEDAFKPSELAFVLSVAEDKRTRLDGSHSLANASVNIQVNNYGSDAGSTKDALLMGLNGRIKSVGPIAGISPANAVIIAAQAKSA